MRKINWKPRGSNKYANAEVGCISLYCCVHYSRNSNPRWYACISQNANMRFGPMRCSLSKAKEDAVRIARELLLDYQTGLTAEMKNFDL